MVELKRKLGLLARATSLLPRGTTSAGTKVAGKKSTVAEVAGTARMPKRKPPLPVRILRAAGLAILIFHVNFIFYTSALVLLYRWINPPFTTLMVYRAIDSGYWPKRVRPVKYKDISRFRRNMLVRLEDYTFFTHHGFDFGAIKNALEVNKRVGRPLSGGSTLTMQTARTLFLIPAKSYVRKYLEAVITVELELFLPKERILELYFSYAEWGKGIYGVQAASYYYYDVPVMEISLERYARLLTILASPLRYNVKNFRDRRQLRTRYNYLVERYLQ